MVVGLLGLQGAFRDHIRHFSRLGARHRIVRSRQDLFRIDCILLPGGESTVMAKFLGAYGMRAPLREAVLGGMPAWGICAGSILMAETVDGAPGALGVMAVSVSRNAYGRQIASAEDEIAVPALDRQRFPAIFIRAPKVTAVADNITVFSRLAGDPVFLRHGNRMMTTFHPELTDDPAFHEYFLSL
jgi:5'-phosphate synthase pdxT subunit